MNRRNFVRFFGAGIGWPLIAHAQQPLALIGFMSSRSAKDAEPHTQAFLRGLSEAGYVPGQNVRIEYRWADGDYQRLPDLAADFVRMRVAAIVAGGGEPSAFAANCDYPHTFSHRRRSG